MEIRRTPHLNIILLFRLNIIIEMVFLIPEIKNLQPVSFHIIAIASNNALFDKSYAKNQHV